MELNVISGMNVDTALKVHNQGVVRRFRAETAEERGGE